ncbi:hypothetical protein [Comamonas thiooxydans]|uniref:hypothetical protein n=1 Tax=Comamonas thiooxydans TaxID=363952 RepID=UPI000B410B70|nr:hypothetical protein [Comamonas thiooxydans]
MRQKEGMRISMLDESMFDAADILKNAPDKEPVSGLSAPSVELFLLVAGAGPSGLSKSRLPLSLKNALFEHLLPLEVQNLVQWEKDKHGKDTYLVLTWKGHEAVEAAKRPKAAPGSLASKRRAELRSR